jgi:hypothetical protein
MKVNFTGGTMMAFDQLPGGGAAFLFNGEAYIRIATAEKTATGIKSGAPLSLVGNEQVIYFPNSETTLA